MPGATLVSVAEYLSTSYEPDCEYLEGVVVERNWGERDHSSAQAEVCFALMRLRAALGMHVFLALRVQVSPTRFRVPDVCVTLGPDPEEQILSRPPFLCVEVLSLEDRATVFQEKIDDYLAFGVPYVWVINPRSRRAYIHTAEGSREAKDGVLRAENPDIAIPLADIFAEL
jgi:Uma2 family endonuclease